MVYVTMMRLSDNQLYSGRTIWQSKSNQYCTNPSVLPLPLHYFTLTRRVNLGHQAAHSSTITRYTPTDPSGQRIGPESHGKGCKKAAIPRKKGSKTQQQAGDISGTRCTSTRRMPTLPPSWCCYVKAPSTPMG